MTTANSTHECENPIPFPKFTRIEVHRPSPNVLEVVLNDGKGNRWNDVLYNEFIECFRIIPSHNDVYCVLLTAKGKHFTVGLDLAWSMKGMLNSKNKQEPGRKALKLQRTIQFLQKSTNLIAECPVPVICAVHGGVIGMGIDLMSACDIRYASQSAFFSIKEVDISVVADIGTFARAPKQIGNHSLLRELVYTGRNFTPSEAQQLGFVSRVFDNDAMLREGALKLCAEIASKSPVTIRGIKLMLNYAMSGKSPRELQEMVQVLNGSLLQTEDIAKAGMAFFQKKKATFSKL